MTIKFTSILLLSFLVGINCQIQFAPFFGKKLQGNFHLAYEYCQSVGMQIVTPDTPARLAELVQFMKKNNVGQVWTCGNDIAQEGQFVCMVNSRVFDSQVDWHLNQPDNSGGIENCVEVVNINGNYKMNDIACTTKITVVCEPARCYKTLKPCHDA